MSDTYNSNVDYVDHQIYRVDGKDCFLEVLNDAFSINKVHIGFYTYNPNATKGKKFTNEVQIYIDIPEFLLMSTNMFNGVIPSLAEKNSKKAKEESLSKNKTIYAEPIKTILGGTSSENLARRNNSRSDGKCLSRVFELSPGSGKPYIMRAKSGPGKIDSQGKGLISPDGPPENIVTVPFTTADELKMFFLTVVTEINAFKAASYSMNFSRLYPTRTNSSS